MRMVLIDSAVIGRTLNENHSHLGTLAGRGCRAKPGVSSLFSLDTPDFLCYQFEHFRTADIT